MITQQNRFTSYQENGRLQEIFPSPFAFFFPFAFFLSIFHLPNTNRT